MTTHGAGISAIEVTLQTERIVASRVFARAVRGQRFLRYLVAAALADPTQTVKEYTIATDVFDRGPGYDPAVDATVRVEAGRLRARLREFYDEEGQHDPLCLEVPKGAYRIIVTRRHPSPPDPVSLDQGPSADTAELLAGGSELLPPQHAASPRLQVFTQSYRRYALPLAGCGLLLAFGGWALATRPQRPPAVRTMAVLPLRNLAGDPAQDFFADSTTDELITELARVPHLRVVSWNSVVQERNTGKSLRRIAGELHADLLVEGSVSRSGDDVRINTQIIDARTDSHLWAGSFEGRASEMVALEDRAAREIVTHAEGAVATDAPPASPGPPHVSVDPAAREAYLRGRNYFDKRQGRASAEAFQRAISLSPAYPAAYAGLALALESEATLGEAPIGSVIPAAMDAAQHSLALQPENGDALVARGSIEFTFLDQWQAAARDLERGVTLSPNNSFGQMMLSLYLDAIGDPNRAVTHMEAAVAIDPLSFYMARHYGSALFYARRYDDALQQLQYAREMHPASAALVDSWISAAYEKKHVYSEAVRYDLQQLRDQDASVNQKQLVAAYARNGWKGYWALRLDGIEREPGHAPCRGYFAGLAALRAGQRGDAVTAFKDAAMQHCYWMTMARTDPLLDDLHHDPAFDLVVASLHLPQSPLEQ